MKKLIYNFLRKFINKHYDVWGTKIETDLPPEFIVTEHASAKLAGRFKCDSKKFHKIMLKAWRSQEHVDKSLIYRSKLSHTSGIYKTFNGHIFVFRARYNNTLGFSQKYLITVFKKSGYQVYS